MTDRLTELESTLRQIQADQGGEATFADFVAAVAADPNEQGHSEALEYARTPYKKGLPSTSFMPSNEVHARNAQVEDWLYLKQQGRAVFKVVAKTETDPPDNVEVELVRDPFGEAHFQVGDVWGGEPVRVISI